MVKPELQEIAVAAEAEITVDADAAGSGGGIKHTQERKTW